MNPHAEVKELAEGCRGKCSQCSRVKSNDAFPIQNLNQDRLHFDISDFKEIGINTGKLGESEGKTRCPCKFSMD